MDWIDRESLRLCCPDFADEFEWRETSKRFQPSAEIVGIDKVGHMPA